MSSGYPGRPLGERRIAFGAMRTTTIQVPESILNEFRKKNINLSDWVTRKMLSSLGAKDMPELVLRLKESFEKEQEIRKFDDWFGLYETGLDPNFIFKTHESKIYMTFSDHLKRIYREVMPHDPSLEHAPNELANRSKDEITSKVYDGVNALRLKVRMTSEQTDILVERITKRCWTLMENDIYWKKESVQEVSEPKQGGGQ
jgi:hypothetical protein